MERLPSKAMMSKHHDVSAVRVAAGKLRMTVDGEPYVVDLAAVSPRLASATAQDQQRVEVSPSGYGLHWPTLDEDLSIDGLIRSCKAHRGRSPARPRSRT